jgi:molybdopterin-guanine dinucleotide biosynthesis protein A
MLGVVLCGGKSSRMGSDKGLLRSETTTWVQAAAEKLRSLGLPVKVSVNKDQYAAYSAIFPADVLIIDDPSLQLRGPLYGVLSSYLHNLSDDLFVLACDMPLMELFLLDHLLQLYQNNPEPDAFVYANDGEPEPLCGIYKAIGLSEILEMYHAQQLTKHSMKFMLDHINTSTVPIADEHKKFFRNFNAHAELNGL